MGEDPDWNIDDIEPTKYYCIKVDDFTETFGDHDCTDNFFARHSGCAIGSALIDFLTNDKECVRGLHIISTVFNVAQKIINIKGPYAGTNECNDNCP